MLGGDHMGRRYTFHEIRADLLRTSDGFLLQLLGWKNHALPLSKGQRNWAAGYLAVQLEKRQGRVSDEGKQDYKRDVV